MVLTSGMGVEHVRGQCIWGTQSKQASVMVMCEAGEILSALCGW